MSLRSTLVPLALSVSLLAGPVLHAAESAAPAPVEKPTPAREKASAQAPAAQNKEAAPAKSRFRELIRVPAVCACGREHPLAGAIA